MSQNLNLDELRQAADRCVKCAVCLPHCPTYALSPQEAESPRGRITLMQGLLREQLELTDNVRNHLQSCLSCGRCEQVCPANVPYTRLLDGTKRAVDSLAETPSPRLQHMRERLASLLRHPSSLKRLASVARFVRRLPGHRLLPNRLARLLRSLPEVDRPGAAVRAAGEAMDAWLFAGCLAGPFEPDSVQAMRTLASAYGIRLHDLPDGLCCAALDQHQGNVEALSEQMTRLRTAVGDTSRPIASLQSGCERGLIDGLNWTTQGSDDSKPRVTDLFELLLNSDRQPAFVTPNGHTALYAPCSVGKRSLSTCLQVLERDVGAVPQLGPGFGCCGAAGDHMLTQPDRADQLIQPIVEEIQRRRLTTVITPNIGCAWHLRANLRARGLNVRVEHPVSWMCRHLER